MPKYEHTAELEEKVELKISSEIEKIEENGTETEISSAISEPSGTNSIFSQGPSFPSIEVAPFTKKTTCRICNKKFRNKFQLECHVKQVKNSYKNVIYVSWNKVKIIFRATIHRKTHDLTNVPFVLPVSKCPALS